jgi:hypothetical protein
MGVAGVKRGRWDSTLTKRTTPRRTGCPSNGFFEVRLAMSRPWQTTISATNGSLRATSARAWAWVIGCRSTSVPAAPILTAPRCFSASASSVGRKVLWPPTLTPLRKTTSATRFPSTSPLERLHSTAAMERPVPGDQLDVVIDRGGRSEPVAPSRNVNANDRPRAALGDRRLPGTQHSELPVYSMTSAAASRTTIGNTRLDRIFGGVPLMPNPAWIQNKVI